MSKSKKIMIVSAAAAALVVLLGCIAMFLLIPRTSNVVGIAWRGEDSFDIDKIQTMQKGEDDFSILAITDLQFDNPFKSKKQVRADLKNMVAETDPDLIVTVGDNFAGIFNHFHVDAFRNLMDEFEVPWTAIFGNHERDFDADLYYLTKELQKSEYGMFETGPTNIDGVGNYVININEGDKIAYSLIMMDCNEEVFLYDEKGERYDAFYESPRFSQVEWYKDNINGITAHAGAIVPSILFTHVPLPEMFTASVLLEQGSDEVEYLRGEGEVYGDGINYGLFDAALNLGSTKYMFHGHEHQNTLSLSYKGIDMSYVPKTGNFSSFNEGHTGGTHILLKSGGVVVHENIVASKLG